jgi:hypothetical protein
MASAIPRDMAIFADIPEKTFETKSTEEWHKIERKAVPPGA